MLHSRRVAVNGPENDAVVGGLCGVNRKFFVMEVTGAVWTMTG